MGDIAYIKEMIIMEKGKPTKLVPILVSKDEGKTLARSYLLADKADVVDNTETKVPLNTESWDLGNNFASNEYVFPVTGYYQIDYGVKVVGTGHLTAAYSFVKVNSVAVSYGALYSGPAISEFNSRGGDVVYGVAGQDLELWGYGNSDDSSAITFAGGLSFLSVYLIST